MNLRQRNKLNMYVLLKEFLLGSTDVTDTWPKFAPLFLAFCGFITEIFTISGKQEEDKTGVASKKAELRGNLEESIKDVSRKCCGYGTVDNDPEFLAKVKLKKGEPERFADADLLTFGENLQTNAEANKEKVAPYDLTDEDLKALGALITQFKASYTKPVSEIEDTSELTELLDKVFASADEELVKMDAIVNAGKTKQPAFNVQYFLKRVVKNAGVHHRALGMWALDFETGDPLYGAMFKIHLKNGEQLKKNIKTTGKKGGIWFNSLPPGDYVFEVSYFGYVTASGTFSINGKSLTMVKVVVKMKKG